MFAIQPTMRSRPTQYRHRTILATHRYASAPMILVTARRVPA